MVVLCHAVLCCGLQEAINWLEVHFIYTPEQVAQLKHVAEKEDHAIEQGTAKKGEVTKKWFRRMNLNRRGKC